LEAVVGAKEEGLVRHVGVTGHARDRGAQHLRALQELPFDSVLLPYNFPMSRKSYISDFEALVSVCAERGWPSRTIKAI
jgi:aryl-alcohol dehydrogenase-like predicted oxidoreductase